MFLSVEDPDSHCGQLDIRLPYLLYDEFILLPRFPALFFN